MNESDGMQQNGWIDEGRMEKEQQTPTSASPAVPGPALALHPHTLTIDVDRIRRRDRSFICAGATTIQSGQSTTCGWLVVADVVHTGIGPGIHLVASERMLKIPNARIAELVVVVRETSGRNLGSCVKVHYPSRSN